MPRKKIQSQSFPLGVPTVGGQSIVCPPLNSKGKSQSEPCMRESPGMTRMALKDDSSRMLSAFSLTDMNRGENPRCDLCQTSDTPEWRKGPNGPRTLCNACGLRYSKQVRKTEKPKKEKSYEWFIYTTPDKVVKVDLNQGLPTSPNAAALAQRAATASPSMRQSPMTVGYEVNQDVDMMDAEPQPQQPSQPPVHLAKPLAQPPPMSYQPPFLGHPMNPMNPMMPMAVNSFSSPMAMGNPFAFAQMNSQNGGAKMNLDFILN
eukprot:TRINITY_DN763_c0_g1_i2.p1 TRINITY_DN763_c0_g1~~TRINITY_DN763_c0_g1_i2.p1  ORF type:complete len:261 (+),score=44.04 TRINITY_DN763_c0_g1_i2:331-1113(+)